MMDISGKDYLSQEEAAHYCCMSLRQFQAVTGGCWNQWTRPNA